MLQGFPAAAPGDQVAELRELRLVQRAVELQVEVHPADPQAVRDQLLRVETGVLHALALEEIGAFPEDFEDGLHAQTQI